MAREITLKGFKEYADRVKKAGPKLQVLADLEADAASQNIARSARGKAPINLGQLRASIQPEPIAKGRYAVNASADYAAYIEFGTKSKVQIPADLAQYAATFKGGAGNNGKAKEMIYAWCKNKGIEESQWYWIYVSIMTKGIHAQPFLFPSVDEEQPKFYKRVQAILDKL